MTKEKVMRINELAKKAKTEKLSPAEAEEQKTLRNEYIAEMRQSLKSQLDNMYIQSPDGSIKKVKSHGEK